MTRISIIDATLRDGVQSLWATRMYTDEMLPIIERIAESGFAALDVMGNVQFDVCVRQLQENPWRRIRAIRSKAKAIPLIYSIRSRFGPSFDFLPSDLYERFLELVFNAGIDQVYVFDGLNDIENFRPGITMARKMGATIGAAITYSESPIHTNNYFKEKIRQILQLYNVDYIMIKDSGGLLKPERISGLLSCIRLATGDIPISLHSHCMTGLAPLVYIEAAKNGIDSLQCTIRPLANGSALPPVDMIAANLSRHRIDHGLKLEGIESVSKYLYDLALRTNRPLGQVREYDEFHYAHQVPGGMITNLEKQLGQIGLIDKLPDVLLETAKVREELGWPVMTTPFSQLVVNQAMLNIVGNSRYGVVPNEVKKYVLEWYGKPPGHVDDDVKDKIIENGDHSIKERRVEDDVMPVLRKAAPGVSDEDLILNYLFPRAISLEHADREQYPLAALIRELDQRSRLKRIVVRSIGGIIDLSR